MNDRARKSAVEGFVTSAADVAAEAWDDARGRISFHTLISSGDTPSNGLVAGLATVESGGNLAKHRHAPAEIYYAVEGAATVTIDGNARVVSAGAAVFIPGNSWHQIDNAFDRPFRFLYVFPADRFEDVEYVFAPNS
jgi:quercetin dioxygenase-like cupin family protein